MNAVIFPCTCSHEFQDSRYGKGKRVHNPAKKGAVIRCTVCNSEKPNPETKK